MQNLFVWLCVAGLVASSPQEDMVTHSKSPHGLNIQILQPFLQMREDKAEPDTIYLQVSHSPDSRAGDSLVVLTLSAFIDGNVASAIGVSFAWDNPRLTYDSVVVNRTVHSQFDIVNTGLGWAGEDSLHLRKYVYFQVSAVDSAGMPPSYASRALATYFFHVSDWDSTKVFTIDTIGEVHLAELVDVQLRRAIYWRANWKGAVTVKGGECYYGPAADQQIKPFSFVRPQYREDIGSAHALKDEKLWAADSGNIEGWSAWRARWYEGGQGNLVLVKMVALPSLESVTGVGWEYSGPYSYRDTLRERWTGVWLSDATAGIRIVDARHDTGFQARLDPIVNHVIKIVLLSGENNNRDNRPIGIVVDTEDIALHARGALTGEVRDFNSEEPIRNATVYLGDSNLKAVTDDSGLFVLETNFRGSDSITISHPNHVGITIPFNKENRSSRLDFRIWLCNTGNGDKGSFLATQFRSWSSWRMEGPVGGDAEESIFTIVRPFLKNSWCSPIDPRITSPGQSIVCMKKLRGRDVAQVRVIGMVGSSSMEPNQPDNFEITEGKSLYLHSPSYDAGTLLELRLLTN